MDWCRAFQGGGDQVVDFSCTVKSDRRTMLMWVTSAKGRFTCEHENAGADMGSWNGTTFSTAPRPQDEDNRVDCWDSWNGSILLLQSKRRKKKKHECSK